MNRRILGYAVASLVLFLQGCKRCQEDGYVKYYATMRVWKSKIKTTTDQKKVSQFPKVSPKSDEKADPGVGTKMTETRLEASDNLEEIPECSSFTS